MSFENLRDADPDVWDEQATSWSRLASELEHTPGDIKRAAGKIDDWHGEGAEAAFTYLKGLRSDYDDAAEALEQIPRVLRWLADEVRDAQKTIKHVIDTVDSNSELRVLAGGKVITDTGPGDSREPEEVDDARAVAQGVGKVVLAGQHERDGSGGVPGVVS